MRVPRHRVGRAAVVLLVAMTVLACTSSTARRFETDLHAPDGSYPLKVAFLDDTGLVQAIEQGNDSRFFDLAPTVERDLIDPTTMVVSWLGGACTDDVSLYFVRIDSGFALALRAGGPQLGACPAIGLSRSVRVHLSQPIDVNTIQVSGRE